MKRRLKKFETILLMVIVAVSMYKISDYVLKNRQFDREMAEIQSLNSGGTLSVRTQEYSENKEDLREVERICALNTRYPDLIGWIEIAGTEIDFPLMHSRDNYYYLDHNFKGEYHPFGTPYVDAENKADFSDQNTVIYGHNVRSGKVFHDLVQYMANGFVDKAPKITISTTTEVLRYEIFAAYVADPYDNFRSPHYGKNEKDIFLNRIRSSNLIKREVPEEIEGFLTLQTCLDNNKRLVIHAKSVSE